MTDAPILDPVHEVTDLENADDFTKKHTPVVTLEPAGDGAVRVTVEVGHLVAHPNLPDHFIQWIALYAGGSEVARFELSAVATAPVVSAVLVVDGGTVLRAVASCNLHGLWAGEAVV
ncbi:MAG: hypothetical protein FDZ70_03815 [Actinobacteria bacterium]|nr:MAG: hypothetical protein FDZ70_03815 [Actinomycetota bacterium]